MKKVLILITVVMCMTGCDLITTYKVNSNIEEGELLFETEGYVLIEKLDEGKADSVLLVVNDYIKEYPYNPKFVLIRFYAHIELKEYEKCRKDVVKLTEEYGYPDEITKDMDAYVDCRQTCVSCDCDSIFDDVNTISIEWDSVPLELGSVPLEWDSANGYGVLDDTIETEEDIWGDKMMKDIDSL